jgi:hypothetical protein
MSKVMRLMSVFTLVAMLTGVSIAANKAEIHTTNGFQGPKANTGNAIHTYENGKSILRVSPEFKVPDTPAPTWRVVDSKGTVYTLDAFKIKAGEKRQIDVPAYVKDIAKIQVYCAWAEVLLGESSFPAPVK